ncbi:peptidylprolyl isomerase [bacterium]|nr:peptidylprolyl isomerase [candidate division CSSED10-310 bacterium]
MIRLAVRALPRYLLLPVFLLGSSARAVEVVDHIIAKVDRSIITASQLREASQPSIEQIRQKYPPEEWDQRIHEVNSQILNQMINEAVCLRFARDNEVVISDAEVEATIMALRDNAGIKTEEAFLQQLAVEGITLDELKENLKKQSIVRRVLRSEVYSKIRVTESDIKDYYESNRDQYQSKAQVRVGVLMVDSESNGPLANAAAEKRIRDLYRQLSAGEDFADMVKNFSDGPSRDQGGDIGFLEEGKALPVIEEKAFQLEVGQFSEPLQTEFGWVIIKVLEKMDAGFKPLKDLRDEIEMTLREKKARQVEQEWFDRQRAMTYIEILDY